MNFGFMFIFLLLQIGVNYMLNIFLIPYLDFQGSPIFANITVALISSLIIAFFGALLATPKGYKKDFYRHAGFHKLMLTYFIVFFALDMLFLLF